MSEDHAFGSLQTINDIKSDIIFILHTTDDLYFATKSLDLYRFNAIRFGHSYDEKFSSFVNSVPKIMLTMRNGQVNVLIALVKDSIMMYYENDQTKKFHPAVVDGTNKIMSNVQYIAVLNDSNLIVVESGRIVRYATNGYNLIETASVSTGFNMKPMNAFVTRNFFHVIEKGTMITMKNDFRDKADRKPYPKEISQFVPITGSNDILIVSNDNSILIMSENMKTNMLQKLPDDIISLQVKFPYGYVLTSSCIRVFTVFGHITEDISLPNRPKKPLMDILDAYHIVIANKGAIGFVKYLSPERHISALTKSEELFPLAIEFCNSIHLPSFNRSSKISELYLSFADAFLKAKEFPKAFIEFQKSGKHPFCILNRFKSILTNDKTKLEDSVDEDIKQKSEILNQLMASLKINNDIINSKGPINIDSSKINRYDVHKALVRLNEQTMMKESVPPVERIDSFYEEIAHKTRDWVNDLNDLIVQKKDLFDFGSPIRSLEEACAELSKYLETVVQSEKQSTRIKIYNTIIISCNFKAGMLNNDMLSSHSPMFVGFVLDFLRKSNKNIYFIYLCRSYGLHEEACKFYLDTKEYDSLVDYLRTNPNTFSCSTKNFDAIYRHYSEQDNENLKTKPNQKELNTNQKDVSKIEKSVEIFFQQNLTDENIDQVISFLNLQSYLPKETKGSFIVKFLEFIIYECGNKKPSRHEELINKLLELLQANDQFKDYGKRQLIENEKESIQKFRHQLKRILEFSDYYSPKDYIPKLSYSVEKLVAMKKGKHYEEALSIIFNEKDISVAIHFCDLVYDPNDNKAKGVYNELFLFKLVNNSDKLMQGSEKSIRISEALPSEDLATRRNNILYILNNRPDRIDPKIVLDNIPGNIEISVLKDYLARITIENYNQLRLLQMKNAFLETTILEKQKQLSTLHSGYVEVNCNLKCSICGKPISDSVFFVLNDNSVTHAACRPNKP